MLNVVMNVGFCCRHKVFVCECLHSLNGVLTGREAGILSETYSKLKSEKG